jgi:hypothetical protein
MEDSLLKELLFIGISFAEAVVGSILIFLGFRKLHVSQLIADTPTSNVKSMAMGLVELKGVLKPIGTFKTALSNKTAAYYKIAIEEYRSTIDDEGKSKSEWENVTTVYWKELFYLVDPTGKICINPAGADMVLPVKNSFYHKSEHSSYHDDVEHYIRYWTLNKTRRLPFKRWGISLSTTVHAPSVGDRRYFEYYLQPGDKLYVMGTAVPEKIKTRDGFVFAHIKKGMNEKTYVISNYNEAETKKIYTADTFALFGIGAFCYILSLYTVINSIYRLLGL